MIWANKLNPAQRFIAWNSLIESQFTYGLYTVAHHFPRILTTIDTIMYRTLKGLLRITGNADKSKFLQLVLGMPISHFHQLKSAEERSKLSKSTLDQSKID